MEFFQYTFMHNALIASLLVAICSGIIGAICVANRTLFLAGGIAHSAYGGVGIAFFFGFPILLGASFFVAFIALLMGYLMLKDRERVDVSMGVIWAVGMAIGILFADLSPGYQDELMSYLFGALVAVGSMDLWILLIYDIILVCFVCLYYYEIMSISYDSAFTSIKGIPIKNMSICLLLFIAFGIVVSMRSVGLILLIALFSIPAYMAEVMFSSLCAVIICSVLLAFIFLVLGLFCSFYFNLTTSATIIIIAALSFIFLLLARYFYLKER